MISSIVCCSLSILAIGGLIAGLSVAYPDVMMKVAIGTGIFLGVGLVGIGVLGAAFAGGGH